MTRQQVLDKLNEAHIPYMILEHLHADTIEEIDALNLPNSDKIVKNLFLRDEKKKRYFLMVIEKNKKVNIRDLSETLGIHRLSFASEEDLMKYLGVKKGSVTPFGIYNNLERNVEVLFDEDLITMLEVGVHPLDNSATVWLSLQALFEIIQEHGNLISYFKV